MLVPRLGAAIITSLSVIFFASVVWSQTDEKSDAFVRALTKARMPTITIKDEIILDEGRIKAYLKLIETMPRHPRINEVKLELYDVLYQGSRGDYAELAAELIDELLKGVDLKTRRGIDIAFEFADFHLRLARDPDRKLVDLLRAERLMKELAAMGRKEKYSLLALDARLRLGDILIRQKRYADGVKELLSAVEEAEEWPDDAWEKMKDYTRQGPFRPEPRDRLHSMQVSAAYALRESRNPEVAELVRKHAKGRWYERAYLDPFGNALQEYDDWLRANFAKRNVERPNIESPTSAPQIVEAEKSTRGRGWLIALSTLTAGVLVFLGIRFVLAQRTNAP